MAYSINCPYQELTAKPCWHCSNHVPDTDECSLNFLATRESNSSKFTGWNAQSYEERLREYEKKRQELLQLSKETLVDLILHRPSF